jgi:hypothetical protein
VKPESYNFKPRLDPLISG